MRIIFMGTPEFAVPCLEKLIQSKHEVAAVYTQPDRPQGRGKKLKYSPVKEVAIKHNIPIEQPLKLKDEETISRIRAKGADLIVVVAYGRLLPAAVLSMPKYGCINVHASLLPKLRGAAPIHWAVINGDKKTGITTMQMVEALDAGDILLQRAVNIDESNTSGEIHDKLKAVGAELLLETIALLEQNKLSPIVQDEDKATYAPMLEKKHEIIDWHKSGKEIVNLIRGMSPWPGVYTEHKGNRIKVWKARIEDKTSAQNLDSPSPGLVTEISKEGIKVLAGNNSEILLQELQLAGKKKIDAADFVKGYKLNLGDTLGKMGSD